MKIIRPIKDYWLIFKILAFQPAKYLFKGLHRGLVNVMPPPIGEGKLIIGKGAGLCDPLIILTCGDVIIGDHVSIAWGCILNTGKHDFTLTGLARQQSRVYGQDILIEDGVWISIRCIILGGVTIGKDSVIGAGSVVTRDIPPGVFAAGNPARVIKKLDLK